MILAELSGLIALSLEGGGKRAGLHRNSDIGACLADRGQTGSERNFTRDKICPARGATGLGVVIGEDHSLCRELVEVRRLAGHDSAVIRADVKPPDVVTHDE